MRRVKVEVWVDLDPIPGAFHTVEDVEERIGGILMQTIPHYSPAVFMTDQVHDA